MIKNKVVINKCYGGFSLSEKAVELLKERKGDPNIYPHSFDIYEDCYPRHDKDLIDIVEELGRESWGQYACLDVVEIEGNLYKINDYDGLENVVSIFTIDWIVIKEEVKE